MGKVELILDVHVIKACYYYDYGTVKVYQVSPKHIIMRLLKYELSWL